MKKVLQHCEYRTHGGCYSLDIFAHPTENTLVAQLRTTVVDPPPEEVEEGWELCAEHKHRNPKRLIALCRQHIASLGEKVFRYEEGPFVGAA